MSLNLVDDKIQSELIDPATNGIVLPRDASRY